VANGTIYAFVPAYDGNLFNAFKMQGDSITPVYRGKTQPNTDDLKNAKLIFFIIQDHSDLDLLQGLKALRLRTPIIPLCAPEALSQYEEHGGTPKAIRNAIKLPITPNGLLRQTNRHLFSR
jgi:hypothetical protein